jgi:hypothetical protein
VINHTQVSCGIEPIGSPTIIYEDNVACVTQMQSGYVKSNVTKYITPKLFYPHELQVNCDIIIFQIKSCNNLADFFTKSLPYATFSKCVAGIGIGMRRLEDLQDLGKLYQKIICRISITLYSFPYVSFDSKVFSQYILMRQCQCRIKYLFLDFFLTGVFHGNNCTILYCTFSCFSIGFQEFLHKHIVYKSSDFSH